MQLDNDFLVDFGDEPDGPVLAHEVKYIFSIFFYFFLQNIYNKREKKLLHSDLKQDLKYFFSMVENVYRQVLKLHIFFPQYSVYSL